MNVSESQVSALILWGEGLTSEFKTCRNQLNRDIYETVCAFLNRHGGTAYNANRPHGFGILDPESFSPYPKNPVIGAFFREIDRADELGSGMRNLMKYGRKYGGADPKLIEGDVFRMIISVPVFDAAGKQTQQVTQQVTRQVKRLLTKTKGAKSRVELMASLSLKDRVNFTRNYLEPALALELIEMTQPDSPKSPTQKYRLTEKGAQLLQNK